MTDMLTPEIVGKVCGQAHAEPLAQLFAMLADAAPTPDADLPDAARQAADLQIQRWYETLLRPALPSAARSGSTKHLARVEAHLAQLPLSDAFMQQARETGAVQAAAAGCVETLMELLAHASDDSMAAAAATAAAAAGRNSVLQALLDDGLSDDALTRALIAAAAGEHIGAVAALLLGAKDRASQIAQADCGGITAIGAAARVGSLDVVRELWSWQSTPTRAAALVNAASEGAESIVRWILTQEACCDDEAPIWQAGLAQAMRAAAAAGHHGIVQALLRSFATTPTLALLEEAFFAAAAGGHAEILATLAQTAGDKREELLAARGDGVLQVAANAGHVEAMRWILDAVGARRNAVLRAEDDGAFCSAAAQGHVEAAQYLLGEVEAGAQTEMLRAYDWEPLREAAAAGHLPMVQHLLQAEGTQTSEALRAADYEAFRRAAAGGHTDVLTHLLSIADAEAETMVGAQQFAALRNAANAGHRETVHMLLERLGTAPEETLGDGANTVLEAAAKSGDIDLLVALLEKLPTQDDAMLQHVGTLWLSTHFLAMPGEPERHAPVRKHLSWLQRWAPHMSDNLRKQALAVATADGEPEIAAVFSA